MILAVETATSACSAALLAGDGTLVAERMHGDGPAHTRRLLPSVHDVLEEGAVNLADLDAVVCGLGPGAYTGMRIGVATARALAQAAGLRLGGAPTLAAVALALARTPAVAAAAPVGLPAVAAGAQAAAAGAPAPAAASGAPLVALLDGKRREVFAGVFRAVGDPASAARVEALLPLVLVPAADLAGFLGQWPGAVVGGDGAALYVDRLPATTVLAGEVATPTAAMVGRAWLADVPGAVEGFTGVLPVYGRAPDAVRWKERTP